MLWGVQHGLLIRASDRRDCRALMETWPNLIGLPLPVLVRPCTLWLGTRITQCHVCTNTLAVARGCLLANTPNLPPLRMFFRWLILK